MLKLKKQMRKIKYYVLNWCEILTYCILAKMANRELRLSIDESKVQV